MPSDHPFLGSLRLVQVQPSPHSTRQVANRPSLDSIPSIYSRPQSYAPSEHLKAIPSPSAPAKELANSHHGVESTTTPTTDAAGGVKTAPSDFGGLSSRLSIVSGPRITKFGDLPWGDKELEEEGELITLDDAASYNDHGNDRDQLSLLSSSFKGLRAQSSRSTLREEHANAVPRKLFVHTTRLSQSTVSTTGPPITPHAQEPEQDPFLAYSPHEKRSQTPHSVRRKAVNPSAVREDTAVITPKKNAAFQMDPSGSPPGFIGSSTPPFSLITLEEAQVREKAKQARTGTPSKPSTPPTPRSLNGARGARAASTVNQDLPLLPSLPSSTSVSSANARLQPRKSIVRLFKGERGPKPSRTLDDPLPPLPVRFGAQLTRYPPHDGGSTLHSGSTLSSPTRPDAIANLTSPSAPNLLGEGLQRLELRPVSIDFRRALPPGFLLQQGGLTPSGTSTSLASLAAKDVPALAQTELSTFGRQTAATVAKVGEDQVTSQVENEQRIARLENQVRDLLGAASDQKSAYEYAESTSIEACRYCGCSCGGTGQRMGVLDRIRGKKLGLAASKMFGSARW